MRLIFSTLKMIPIVKKKRYVQYFINKSQLTDNSEFNIDH